MEKPLLIIHQGQFLKQEMLQADQVSTDLTLAKSGTDVGLWCFLAMHWKWFSGPLLVKLAGLRDSLSEL